MMKKKLKRDKYMGARGGTSAFYNIYCSHCRHWLLLYQKDGVGNLFRMYLDRIHAPENLVSLFESLGNPPKFKGLSCSHCNTSIGIPMIYKKEDRPALRIIRGSIVKKKSNGSLPAPAVIDSKEATDEDSAS
jgi:hypothetical protein